MFCWTKRSHGEQNPVNTWWLTIFTSIMSSTVEGIHFSWFWIMKRNVLKNLRITETLNAGGKESQQTSLWLEASVKERKTETIIQTAQKILPNEMIRRINFTIDALCLRNENIHKDLNLPYQRKTGCLSYQYSTDQTAQRGEGTDKKKQTE